MTEQHFVIALVQGTAEDLNRDFVKCPGMTAIEVTEDTYNFLYNSLIENQCAVCSLRAGNFCPEAKRGIPDPFKGTPDWCPYMVEKR